MPDPIDDLARRWRLSPDGPGTVAMCDALRGASPASRRALVDEVGRVASDHHGGNGAVLLALARVYAEADRLIDAHRVLVAAARVAPRDVGVFRLTGEVLLRRGEAERAEAALQRAVQLGATDGDTAAWLGRATSLKALQAAAGPHAVAVELKGTAVHAAVGPAGAPAGSWHHVVSVGDDGGITAVRARPFETEDGTKVSAGPLKTVPREPTIELDAFPGDEAPGVSSPVTEPIPPMRPGAEPPPGARRSTAGGTAIMSMNALPAGGHPMAAAAPHAPALANGSWPGAAASMAPIPPAASSGSQLAPAPFALATTAPGLQGPLPGLPVAPPRKPRGSRWPLIVVIVLLVLATAGALAAWQLGLFSSAAAPPPASPHGGKHPHH